MSPVLNEETGKTRGDVEDTTPVGFSIRRGSGKFPEINDWITEVLSFRRSNSAKRRILAQSQDQRFNAIVQSYCPQAISCSLGLSEGDSFKMGFIFTRLQKLLKLLLSHSEVLL
eukprot:Gb_02505 [translate_table: standard]